MILNRRVAEVFPEYCDVQKIAKETMEYIKTEIRAGMPLSEVRSKDDRVYIEKGNNMKLGDVSYFTFEPHISTDGSKYGFKREDMYYFDNEVLKKL